ncbi:hypothetical protein PsorP6_014984 [Peronosclerospora sorghi]|uniref:Uncharacterized protein n=1 Tax=Peronosclerospora sorghi TaxID=230839 RepID=A0ACC0VQY3_9STRA|nr:hypothetical protein PsorP6_014984 [Peronosclerospora sorghi]
MTMDPAMVVHVQSSVVPRPKSSSLDGILVHKSLKSTSASESASSPVVPEELAAAVVSACFPPTPSDRATDRVPCRVPDPQRKSRREKEAIRKRIYHQKIKDERRRLRQTVEDLSSELHELTQGTRTRRRQGVAWKECARDEQTKLEQATTEQGKLLVAVEDKASCIQELCKQVFVDKTVPKYPVVRKTRTNPPFDYTMYRGHLRRVHESYARVGEIFRAENRTEGIVNSIKRREGDGEIEYFEFRNKFTQPFSYHHTERTMWKLAQLRHRQEDREEFWEVADPSDTLVVRFRLRQTLTSGSTVSVLQRHVVCRFVEKNRTTLVWKTHSEGEGIFQGMHSDETGWLALEAFDDTTTDVMVCVRQAPMKVMLSSSGTPACVEEFHEMVKRSVSEDMSEVTSALDKLLLEDTLADIEI